MADQTKRTPNRLWRPGPLGGNRLKIGCFTCHAEGNEWSVSAGDVSSVIARGIAHDDWQCMFAAEDALRTALEFGIEVLNG